MKQWPGIFDYKKMRGETRDNFESRMKETGGLSNWRPTDGGRGIRGDTGPGVSEGKRFPQYREPNPSWVDAVKNAFRAQRKSK